MWLMDRGIIVQCSYQTEDDICKIIKFDGTVGATDQVIL